MMLKDKLAKLLEGALSGARQKGLIPQVALPEVNLEHPQNPEHGDYASPIALKLGRSAGLDPYKIAQNLVSLLPSLEEIEETWVAPPGFINFKLKKSWLAEQVEEILRLGEHYGDLDLGKGKRVQVEFVSVNPTGPLHVGHGRGAVLGSTLSNILQACGFEVEREYYINDAGNQILTFSRSLYSRYQQALGLPAELPPEAYQGGYLLELAQEIARERGDALLKTHPDEALDQIGQLGVQRFLELIKRDLELLGVRFDNWFSEKSLYESGLFERVMNLLMEEGWVEEKDGTLWFTSTELGEDRDAVLVRSNEMPTYFASDIAYHYNKFLERGFDQVIDIWGADHQGHVPRMKAAVRALGIAPERLKVIISQMVNLRRGEEEVKVSKRMGEFVTLRELVEEVGVDACRFFFLSRSADSQMDFDLELAKRQAPENPVYYVQYAHARIAGILRLARGRKIDYRRGDTSYLKEEAEFALISELFLFPEVIELAAMNLEPHHLPHYAQELATTFHNFYERCRVVSQDEALTWARLKLVEATRIVLSKLLKLMGITAPEQM